MKSLSCYRVTCTEKSIGIHKMILAQDEEVLSELCENFTEEQRADLLQLMDMLLKNIDME